MPEGIHKQKKVSSFLDFLYISKSPFPKQFMNKTCSNLFILVDFVCSSHKEENFLSSELEEQHFSGVRIGVLCLLY